MRGEVHHRVDPVLGSMRRNELAIAGVAHDERSVQHGLAEAGHEIVEHDDGLAGFAELSRYVAADVTCATGDQDCRIEA